MSFMWISLVETNVWMRNRSAPLSASPARSMSPGTTRASAAMTGPFTVSAISRTASNSPSLETGKPASMMSTFSRASCSAISTFSARVRAMPGACSPSRSVVSKMRTSPSGIGDHLLVGVQPRHHRAEPRADLLDLGPPGLLAHLLEVREAVLGLSDPLLRELAALDLVQDAAHLRAGLLVDDARSARVVAVLRGVGDGVPHPAHPALVEEVDDELELVETLEVRDLRLVAGRDERVEARGDQRRRSSAQDGLLAEEVGLGLLLERGLDDARAEHADAVRVRERALERLAGRVALHGDERRGADTLDVGAADEVSGPLRRDHRDVDALRRLDLAEVDVEPVREHQRVARLEVRRDVLLVHLRLRRVGEEHHDDVGLTDGVRGLEHTQSRLLRLLPRGGTLAEAHQHVVPGVLEVQRVRVSLAAVAEDRDRLPLQCRTVRTRRGVDPRHLSPPFVGSPARPGPLAV